MTIQPVRSRLVQPSTRPRPRPRPDRSTRRDVRSRIYAARGVLVNTGFDIGLSALGPLRGFVLAALLSRQRLRRVGRPGRVARRAGPAEARRDQRQVHPAGRARPEAGLPAGVHARADRHRGGDDPHCSPRCRSSRSSTATGSLVPPGLVLITVMVASALQAPIWVYYRQMDFVRQRALAAIEPVVGFVVASAGHRRRWATGRSRSASSPGAWSAAIAAIVTSPYPLRWRYDRGALRVYVSFSAPIFIATACCDRPRQQRGASPPTRTSAWPGSGRSRWRRRSPSFTSRVDDLVSGTLYPAICAMQNRLDLLRESFVKTNRLALMWAMPFGIARWPCSSADLVSFVLGEKWQPAVVLLRSPAWSRRSPTSASTGTTTSARVARRADRGRRVASTVTFLAVGIPLLFSHGLAGLAVGIAAQARGPRVRSGRGTSRSCSTASGSSRHACGRCCRRCPPSRPCC